MQSIANSPSEKKQRISRACDTCRRRKVKCDQDALSGVRCQRCVAASLRCTWDDEVKKRGRKRRADDLEARLEALEAALALKRHERPTTVAKEDAPESLASTSDSSPSQVVEFDDEDDLDIKPLIDRVSRLEIGAMDTGVFALGTSAGRRVAQTVNKLRADLGPFPEISALQPDPWEAEELMKWRKTQKQFTFPPLDLIPVLVEIFLQEVNPHLALFHAPTFREDLSKNLHYSDKNYAVVLLLVCAIGSRFVNDPRVLLPGQPKRSAGWIWYSQCEITRLDILAPATLSKIQAYLLATFYLGGVFNGRATWMLPTMALRSMQEMGVDQKRVYSAQPSAEDEKWKRCFWVAAILDVSIASEVGRPCFLVDGSFDIDLPIACDDEFWTCENPEQAFKQPPNQPSTIAAFVHQCKIKTLHVKAMRILFSAQAQLGPRQDALREMEVALEEWLEETPAHLDWSVIQHKTTGDDFFFLAARLSLEYHYFSLIIHRPFVSLRKATPESSNAFAICTSAARAICSIFRAVTSVSKNATFVVMHTMTHANSCCHVLLLALWGAREMNLQVDTEGILNDIQTCLDVLEARAPFFRHAEVMHQRLSRLATRENVSFPAARPMNRWPSSDAGSDVAPLFSRGDAVFGRMGEGPSSFPAVDFGAPAIQTEMLSHNSGYVPHWGETGVPGNAFLLDTGLREWNPLQGSEQAGFPLGMHAGPSAGPGTVDFGSNLLWEWSQASPFTETVFDPQPNRRSQ